MSIRSITVIGPFATEYSLARVNRALALALKEAYPDVKVRLWANEQYCDRLPGKAEYQAYPFLKELYDGEHGDPDLVIFNNFPKSHSALYGLKDLPGKIKLAYLAWEESIFPQRWVEEINRYLHGLMVTSEHVKKVFSNSGVSVPMQVVLEGLDIPFAKAEKLPVPTKKGFKLLHISSGHFRKGVDILLNAYLKEFTSTDDISLVLKIFPGVSTSRDIDAILAKRAADAPEVVLIRDNTLSDGQLRYLYEASDAMVLPSRAEGFGLPMAEALQLKKPLITTGYSGQMDFCNDENSFLLNYKLTDSKSDLNIPGAKVAEPEQQDLQKAMRELFDHRKDTAFTAAMTENGLKDVAPLRWSNSARNSLEFAEKVAAITPLKHLRLAVVSTWNSRCGVAEYSRAMYSSIWGSFAGFRAFANSDIGDRTAEDESYVTRSWQYGEMDFSQLQKDLEEYQPDILHFQYNLSFYSPALMGALASRFAAKGVKALITLHSVHPGLSAAIADFNRIQAVMVHSEADRELLVEMGATNVQIIDHGLPDFPDEPKNKLTRRMGLPSRPVIATHGMIHDKKGVLELVKAVEIVSKDIPEVLLLAHNSVNPNNSTSAAIFNQVQNYVKEHNLEHNVILINEFLELNEVMKILHLSDLIVLPYADIKEGASGAVRICIAAKRPLIITESYIFRNLETGFRVKDNAPETLAAAIQKVLKDPSLQHKLKQDTESYAARHLWPNVSLDYLNALAKQV